MNETELILTSLRNCRRVDLYVDPKPLDSSEARQLEDFQQRRANHEPLQYILGNCEFMDCNLLVDPRVLIPRPETEILVETVLEKAHSLVSLKLNILDIGTGSGNIAIALAKHIEECRVTAVDFSQDCLDLAASNARMNSVQERIQFIHSDLFSSLNPEILGASFDIIVSNPPYVSTSELDSLPAELEYEPRAALDGGKEGLDFYRRIFVECGMFLKPKGWLVLEIGSLQANDLKDTLNSFEYLQFREVRKDLCGRDRVVVVQCV